MNFHNSIISLSKELPLTSGNILITGATGLIGSCIIAALIEANKNGAKFNIYAMSRSAERLAQKFGDAVIPVVQDIIEPLSNKNSYDFIVHCASNADPRTYARQPVETILTNIIGNKNILDYCKQHTATRMLLTSTFEVYGTLDGVSEYKENMSGVIDQTILRNGYPESKRCCELLLRSYVDEYDVDAVIVRLPSVYGPTMLDSDSKAHAQFIKNAINHENIVLKSKGEQVRSYCYVIDAISGIFKVLFNGISGEIYNVSNENSIASIAEVAKGCAALVGTNVVFELPDDVETKGFSRSKNCILDNTKIKNMGWKAKYSLAEGLEETINELKKNS